MVTAIVAVVVEHQVPGKGEAAGLLVLTGGVMLSVCCQTLPLVFSCWKISCRAMPISIPGMPCKVVVNLLVAPDEMGNVTGDCAPCRCMRVQQWAAHMQSSAA